ncbi:hypothetical protein TNIN_193261 [Trichonephila inaurata madagascariensis]|uniref:Uncharacterized protein n=1 Tax=Trichonephila inaurata madagascariensis TaxID=2747483 RepID=A0A8X6IJP4_9ARAC|nr:hypothetical protein TNIN_193261 [Trichonephila inaurata madagascariensis]
MTRHILPNPNWVFWLTRCSHFSMTKYHSPGEISPEFLVAVLLRRLYDCLRCYFQVLLLDDSSICFSPEAAPFLRGRELLLGYLVMNDVAAPSLDDVSASLLRSHALFLITLSDCREDAGDPFFSFTRSGASLLGIVELKASRFSLLTSAGK